jgi:hypothetical protein
VHGLAILLDELTGIKLGVDHHGVGRGVTEQRLNDVHGRVVVQMFGCKKAPAIVRQQHERRANSLNDADDLVKFGVPLDKSFEHLGATIAEATPLYELRSGELQVENDGGQP